MGSSKTSLKEGRDGERAREWWKWWNELIIRRERERGERERERERVCV